MVGNSSSILSRNLSDQELFSVRQLREHPGWAILQQWLTAKADSEASRLEQLVELHEVHRSQGAVRAFREAASAVDTLTSSSPKPSGRR